MGRVIGGWIVVDFHGGVDSECDCSSGCSDCGSLLAKDSLGGGTEMQPWAVR
jgi:hypothetical protein